MLESACILLALLSLAAWLYATVARYRSARDEYVYCEQAPLSAELVAEIAQKVGPYRPPWWYNSHLASVLSFGFAPRLRYVHQSYYHDDGTMFVCSWFPHVPQAGSEERVVILCPGLGLDATSVSMMVAVRELADAGNVVVVVNPKGFMHPLTTPRCYCSTDISDLEHLVEHVIPPTCKLFIMGYSAGSNVAARFASYGKNRQRLLAVALVCTISKYQEARAMLECGTIGQLYSYALGFKYQQMLIANEKVLRAKTSEVTWARLKRQWVRLSEMDKLFAEEFLSYASEEHYLTELNHGETLANVQVPVLILQPKDDPLFGGRCHELIPRDLHTKNPNSVLILNDFGGHFGFVGGWTPLDATGSYTYPAHVARLLFEKVLESKSTFSTSTASS